MIVTGALARKVDGQGTVVAPKNISTSYIRAWSTDDPLTFCTRAPPRLPTTPLQDPSNNTQLEHNANYFRDSPNILNKILWQSSQWFHFRRASIFGLTPFLVSRAVAEKSEFFSLNSHQPFPYASFYQLDISTPKFSSQVWPHSAESRGNCCRFAQWLQERNLSEGYQLEQ